MAISARVARIEQFHRLEIDFADGKSGLKKLANIGRLLSEPVECFVNKGVNRIVFFAENLGMVGIRGKPFESINNQFLQAGDIGAELVDFILNADKQHRFQPAHPNYRD